MGYFQSVKRGEKITLIMTLFLFIESKTIENLISSKKKVLENYDCDDDNYDNNEKYDDIRNDSNDVTTTTTTTNNNSIHSCNIISYPDLTLSLEM